MVWARTSLRETFGIAALIVLLSMLGILIRGGPVPLDTLTLGLSGVGLSLMLVVSLDALRQPVASVREYWVEFLLVLYCTAVLVVFLPGLFPIHWVQSGSVINIFGHATGLVLGFLAGIVAMHTTPRVTLGETTPM